MSKSESLSKIRLASLEGDCKIAHLKSELAESESLDGFVQEDSNAITHPTCGLKNDQLYFLRPKEVAEILGISRQMLWRMRKAGKFIHPVKITDFCVGFRSDELLSWMNARQMVDNHE